MTCLVGLFANLDRVRTSSVFFISSLFNDTVNKDYIASIVLLRLQKYTVQYYMEGIHFVTFHA